MHINKQFQKQLQELKIEYDSYLIKSLRIMDQQKQGIVSSKQKQNHIFIQNQRPSFSQIQKCLTTLKKIAPALITDSFVDAFFESYTQRQIKTQSDILQTNVQAVKGISLLSRGQENQIVAANFILLNNPDQKINLPQQLQTRMYQVDYDNLIKRVISIFFRRIEILIRQYNNEEYVHLNQNRRQIMTQIIINCKQRLEDQKILLLTKCMKKVFKIDKTPFFYEDAIQIYRFIIGLVGLSMENKYPRSRSRWEKQSKAKEKILKKRLPTFKQEKIQSYQKCLQKKKGDIENDFLKNWNKSKEQFLFDCYKRSENYRQIKNDFRKRWPNESTLITRQALRSQLYKTLRIACRKLTLFANKCKSPMPKLMQLNANRVKQIIYYAQGKGVKLQLIEFYRKERYDPNLLKQTIICINEYLTNSQNTNKSSKDSQQINYYIDSDITDQSCLLKKQFSD